MQFGINQRAVDMNSVPCLYAILEDMMLQHYIWWQERPRSSFTVQVHSIGRNDDMIKGGSFTASVMAVVTSAAGSVLDALVRSCSSKRPAAGSLAALAI